MQWDQFGKHPAIRPLPVRLHGANYLLALILLGAMLLLRLGRSLGFGKPLEWGTALLLIFLITMILALLVNHRRLLHYPNHLRQRIMLYGALWSVLGPCIVPSLLVFCMAQKCILGQLLLTICFRLWRIIGKTNPPFIPF